MNEQPPTPTPRKRSLLFAALAGCAVIALCVLLAGVAGAGTWFYRQLAAGADRQLGPEEIRTGLEALPVGNASSGEQIFLAKGGCAACHSLDPDVRIVGPSLAGVASRAATRKPGDTAERYLYESIVDPAAYTVAGFHEGIMPADYSRRLNAQQMADLLAFLMTQK